MKLVNTAGSVFIIVLILISFSKTAYAEEGVSGDEQSVKSESQESLVTITLEVPIFSTIFSNTPIAEVNGEPILLKELKKEMESFHREMSEETLGGERAESSVEVNYIDLLNRIINSRLVVEEARNIGLDELPEIQTSVKDFSEKTLRGMLFVRHLDETRLEAPEEEVEKIFRELVKEYRLSSILFKEKEEADNVVEELRSKKNDFDSLAKRLKEEGLAEGTEEGGNFVKVKDLLPHVFEVIKDMEIGEISPVVRVVSGHIIFKIEEVRYPDNPEAREQARQRVLSRLRTDTIKAYIESLEKKYTDFDETLLKSIDFDAEEPGIGDLLMDSRAVAAIEDEDPVTVGDVAAALKKKFFHGVERAIGKMNNKKMEVASEIIQKRVLLKEALRLGLDRTEEYRERVHDYEQGMLFGAFVDRAVSQDVNLSQEEVEDYYEEHKDDYTAPKMLRIESLVFTKSKYAENAAKKLRKGTDFKWMLENAEGQVDKDSGKLLDFGERFWTLSGLPEDVRDVVADATNGDIRIYESQDGDFYVLSIVGERPAKPKPFDAVKLDIANKLYDEKLVAAVEKWSEALRKEYEVRIFVLGEE